MRRVNHSSTRDERERTESGLWNGGTRVVGSGQVNAALCHSAPAKTRPDPHSALTYTPKGVLLKI